MSQICDLSGKVFGGLRVLAFAGKTSSRKSLWACECECTNESIVYRDNLVTGHTRSCSCLQRDTVIAMNKRRSGK